MNLTISIIPRERYSEMSGCLKYLIANTPVPFRLSIIDNGIPLEYRAEILTELNKLTNIEWIKVPHLALPNASRNAALRHCKTRYICLLENDILVSDGWIENMIHSMKSHHAQAVAPIIFLPDGGVHFDWRLDKIIAKKSDEEITSIDILAKPNFDEYDSGTLATKQVDFIEQHCILFDMYSTSNINTLFDEELNTRCDIDMCLRLWEQGSVVVLEPNAKVIFKMPQSHEDIEIEEQEYFKKRWDIDMARKSHSILVSRWKLINLPESTEFVENRLSLA